MERASKTLRLNGGHYYDPAIEKLLAANQEKTNVQNKTTRFKTAALASEARVLITPCLS
jgi:hypothetical protein